MSYVARAAVWLVASNGGGLLRLVELSAAHRQTSSRLIYSCVKRPVRAATFGEDIYHDVCQATGNALLTRVQTKAVRCIQSGYQTVWPPTPLKATEQMVFNISNTTILLAINHI